MKNFREEWARVSALKDSLLCVGIDASEPGQRSSLSIPENVSKVEWTLRIIDQVAPYTAAIKLNRNYYKDLSRVEMRRICSRIRELDMLSIDDTKLADIGDTNAAAIYHAHEEGYDSLTYAPFPGNSFQTALEAKKQGMGLIMLVLMSNPEFKGMKDIQVEGRPFYQYLAEEALRADVDGVVIGAPSQGNHIRSEELDWLAKKLVTQTVLVPGVGAQGGDIAPVLQRFGRRTLVNVGRTIIYAENPAEEAKRFRDIIRAEIAQFPLAD